MTHDRRLAPVMAHCTNGVPGRQGPNRESKSPYGLTRLVGRFVLVQAVECGCSLRVGPGLEGQAFTAPERLSKRSSLRPSGAEEHPRAFAGTVNCHTGTCSSRRRRRSCPDSA
jgi:hypothetical protein